MESSFFYFWSSDRQDLIEHIAELYAGPNRDAEIDEDEFEQP